MRNGWFRSACLEMSPRLVPRFAAGRAPAFVQSPSHIYLWRSKPGRGRWFKIPPASSQSWGATCQETHGGGLLAGWLGPIPSPCLSHERLPHRKRKWRFGWENQFVTTVPSISSSVQHPSCYFWNLVSPLPLAPKLGLQSSLFVTKKASLVSNSDRPS